MIAHRGASRSEPENTLAAFRAAARYGADAVELDVRRTADDRLVIHHDAALPDGRPVVGTTAGELPPHVPSLAAALDSCAGMWVNVEIKNAPGEPDFDPDDRIADATLSELLGRDEPARWLISSFRRETIDRCRAVAPEIRTAWLCVQPPAGIAARLARAGHAAVHPYYEQVDATFVRECHGEGLEVNVWTCDDPEAMVRLAGWGVDGICTNVPNLALRVLGR